VQIRDGSFYWEL
jgi:hypothetical protein